NLKFDKLVKSFHYFCCITLHILNILWAHVFICNYHHLFLIHLVHLLPKFPFNMLIFGQISDM
ncbi:hypothetical protein ACJX0J_016229, partial [Zea mays]